MTYQSTDISGDQPMDVQEISNAKNPVGVCYGGLPALKKRFDNALLIGIPLAGTIATPFWVVRHGMSWIEVTAFVVTYAFVGFGVGLGLHRYFSHRSFQPKQWIAVLLGAAGSMAFQGSILRWVAAMVGSGLAPREAADKLGISYETARNQLKSTFSKVGISRQSELSALLTKLVLRAEAGPAE